MIGCSALFRSASPQRKFKSTLTARSGVPPIAGRHPADASVAVATPSYVAVSGAAALRPVDPKGWQDLNRQVTPKGH